MIDYLYDGTFEGFLTCIFYNYYGEKAQGIYLEKDYQPNMIYSHKIIESNVTKADQVYRGMQNKLKKDSLLRVYRCFLSDDKEKENILLAYIKFAFKEGQMVDSFHAHPTVYKAQQLERKVTREAHRFLGILRFSEIEDVLFSEIDPDHDILELIAAHFAERYHEEKFVIYDEKRKKAVICQNSKWYISPFDISRIPEISTGENHIQKLWKAYFEQMAIKERLNPRCQSAFMPKRYWKNISEVSIID